MPYRLRYQAHEIELPLGEFHIGRSAECQLALDDALVSRRHAVIRIRKDGVTVEDLGSRNGVLLNGTRIEGTQAVGDEDRILIGSQELRVYFVDENAQVQLREHYRRHTQTLGVGNSDIEAQMAAAVASPPAPELTVSSRNVQSFQLLVGVADKALGMGRAEEAERILQGLLLDILSRAREGKGIDPTISEQAARYAARIAGATAKASWIDYVFELYAALTRPLPAAVVDELYTVVRKVKGLDPKGVRSYLAVLREMQATFGPADRFVVQRIEGLERLIAAK